ncbi:hypothetical protein B0T17DRAFT_621102 [Bombardia bombarda]|uniref:Uncharacterized protein n=1 Tax=Bombardia bombarda TaxID=252184 RepID=A0AA39TRV0_9PEZI|nr:hypothetical protein B0T17DRAFT_621102 [Bombardia bombarda]
MAHNNPIPGYAADSKVPLSHDTHVQATELQDLSQRPHASSETTNRVTTPEPGVDTDTPTILDKTKALKSLIITSTISSLFCVFYCTFVYIVLIEQHVQTPGVFWDASKANLVVGVLSQTSALLTDAAMKALLGALRPALLAMAEGTSFATWVGLGASDWITVLQVAAAEWFLNVACDFRHVVFRSATLSMPVMALAFGSILKFQADFEPIFVPSNTTMPIYAGLIAPDLQSVNLITAADLSMFFETWGSNMLSTSKYAQDLPMNDCTDNCRSVMLPGGLGIARQAKQALNETVFTGNTFDSFQTIRIDKAVGFVIKYEVTDSSSLQFDLDKECVYAGAQISNGLQVCIKQDGMSMIVGWSACPKHLLDDSACNTNTTWRSLPITSATRMSLYQQSSSTTYDRESQAIANITPIGSPIQTPLSAANYTQIFTKALVPSTTASQADTYNIDTFIYTSSWMHRTFLKSFPDDHNSTVTYLHNILAVPVQFAVVANIYANYTLADLDVKDFSIRFPLSENMLTVATGGQSSSRLRILPWAGYLFIAADVSVHVVVLGWIIWLLRGADERVLKGRTGVVDLAAVREADTAVWYVRGKRRAIRWWWLVWVPVGVERWVRGLRGRVAGLDEEMRFGGGGGGGDNDVDGMRRSLLDVALDQRMGSRWDDLSSFGLARENKWVRVLAG